MDRDQFESLTRRVGAASSRRTALATLLGIGLVGIVPGMVRADDAADVSPESLLVKGCRLPGQRCKKSSTCCGDAARCRQKRCACLDHGKSCLVTTKTPFGPVPVPVHALCCTNNCSKHTNKCQ